MKTISLDAVFHALSRDILLKELKFDFALKNCIFADFVPIFIVLRFSNPKFQNFPKTYLPVDSSCSAASIDVLAMKNNRKPGKIIQVFTSDSIILHSQK